MEEHAKDHINYARELTTNGCYSEAFELYILAFEKDVVLKHLYEQEFHTLLIEHNDLLIAAGKIEDVFTNFGKAIQVFPENISFLNDIGKYFFKYGYFSKARYYFQKALQADPGFVIAEKNFNSINNIFLKRWHFRMVNDKIRNEMYRIAIHESIAPTKESVIDVRTGTGLLAMFAYECKPAVITACDASNTMTEMAECICQDMGINDIKILNKISTSMTHLDVGGKHSLLITELFDAGLFGEQVLQTIAHAWEHLLNGVGRVLPCRAEFFVCAVNSKDLNLKYQLGVSAKTLLNIHSHVIVLTRNKTYDCEDAHFFKDIKYITCPESLLKVDFNSYDDILDKLQRNEPYSVELKAVEDGEANILIGWFNLQLTENVSITTDPRSPMRCNAWQQAVFFNFIPTMIKRNDIIKSHFSMNRGKLTLLPDCNNLFYRISPETLRFLNDSEYIKMIMGCIGMACVYLGQIVEMSEIKIVDLCPFPVFGLQMLKRGARSLVCSPKTNKDEEFIVQVMRDNNIGPSKFIVLNSRKWWDECFKESCKYHVIFCNPFELCGNIKSKHKDCAQDFKDFNLFPGGLFMPSCITLMGQLVDCHWLDINNRVYDENVCNYKISKYMNEYQVSQNFSINISHLEYEPLTEPAPLGIYDSELTSEVVNIPVINNGSANAILCWYKIELMENLGEISTNRSNSFVYNMAFLAHPKVNMEKGNIAKVLRCVDPDGIFKLKIDVEEAA